MHLQYRNVNNAFAGLVEGIHTGKIPTHVQASRYGEVATIEEPVTITYHRPRERVLFNAVRDANPFLALYESLWLLAGRNDVAPLAYYCSRMQEFSDDGQTFNGAYGYRWRHANWGYEDESEHHNPVGWVDQLEILINHLRRDPYSRRAVLSMWNIHDDLLKIDGIHPCTSAGKGCVNGKWQNAKGRAMLETGANCPSCKGTGYQPGSKDVCCNLAVHFRVEMGKCRECKGTGRDNSKLGDSFRIPCAACMGKPHDQPQYLNMTVFNRSNDLTWGALGTNAVTFSILQEYVAAHLGLEVGRYHQISDDLHVYTSRWQPEAWLAWEHNYDRRQDPYERDDWQPYPLVQDPTTFDGELPQFVKRHSSAKLRAAPVTDYTEPFFRWVAGPMLNAFHCYKDDPKTARAWCDVIVADDWRLAATAWLERRLAKRQQRGSVSNYEAEREQYHGGQEGVV